MAFIAKHNILIDGALGYTKGDPVADDVVDRYELKGSVERVKPVKAETPPETPPES